MNSNSASACNTSHYILVTSDAYHVAGTRVPAIEVISGREKIGYWPIYKNTRNRKSFKGGDICVLYAAGTKSSSKSFIGEFVIASVETLRRDVLVDHEDILNDIPSIVLKMKLYKQYKIPKPIDLVLLDLDFYQNVTNPKKWGVSMMGGSRRISESDYHKIININ
jgi:hypothetical protein